MGRTLTHPDPTDFLGTSHLEATGDTLTLKTFYDQVCGIAHQLYLEGDTSPLGVRKVKALGLLTGQPTTTSKPHVKVYARVDAQDLDLLGVASNIVTVPFRINGAPAQP